MCHYKSVQYEQCMHVLFTGDRPVVPCAARRAHGACPDRVPHGAQTVRIAGECPGCKARTGPADARRSALRARISELGAQIQREVALATSQIDLDARAAREAAQLAELRDGIAALQADLAAGAEAASKRFREARLVADASERGGAE